jgi:hypothetical protein
VKVYQYSELKKRFSDLGYQWPFFHLIGVRSKADKPNAFDDLLFLIDGANIFTYTGTTNPGKFWLQNFQRKEGTAVLKPGQYIDTWVLGRHKGVYKAWTQAKNVTVFRDDDKDGKSEDLGKEQTGIFGINIHRANENAMSIQVDKWSAGCQVFNNPVQFKQFILLSELSKQEFFTYTLLEEFVLEFDQRIPEVKADSPGS